MNNVKKIHEMMDSLIQLSWLPSEPLNPYSAITHPSKYLKAGPQPTCQKNGASLAAQGGPILCADWDVSFVYKCSGQKLYSYTPDKDI